MKTLHCFDVVKLIKPQGKGTAIIPCGAVGTIVDRLSSGFYIVEFEAIEESTGLHLVAAATIDQLEFDHPDPCRWFVTAKNYQDEIPSALRSRSRGGGFCHESHTYCYLPYERIPNYIEKFCLTGESPILFVFCSYEKKRREKLPVFCTALYGCES